MKRISISILLSCILGIFCVVGVSIRRNITFTDLVLWQIFYNRIILGIVVGLSGWIKAKPVIRGAVAGLIVSFSVYIGSGFSDPVTFFAGIIYGVIIDLVATKYSEQ